MNHEITPVTIPDDDAQVRVEPSAVTVELGQWYWRLVDQDAPRGRYEEDDDLDDGEEGLAQATDLLLESDADASLPEGKRKCWLGCVTKIGSNFIELTQPRRGNSTTYARIHIDDFWTDLLYEPNAEQVIRARIEAAQAESARLLAEIQALTQRLGVSKRTSISYGPSAAAAAPPNPEARALAVLSSSVNVDHYKAALIEAQKDKLPALFDGVKEANAEMIRWMSAGAIALEAQAGEQEDVLDVIRARLLTISIYAGLTEDVVKVADGDPAPETERLRVMQGLAYMDEECLLFYQSGGLEFSNIHEFDAWLAQPEHMQKILPFPRCVVAMRVRRDKKERPWDGSLEDALIKFRLEQADKSTFLYIRNGGRLYRLETDIDFGPQIFPSKAEFDPSEPLMFSMFSTRVDRVITRAEYEERLAAEEARSKASKAWEKANNAKPQGERERSNPHWEADHDITHGWQPFDRSSLYYDEAQAEVAERVQQYNRIAVLLQGLFDRSDVLHPHAPVQTWTPDGFAAAIELVYDASDVLAHGEAPDFEAYRAQLNAKLTNGSVVVGQEDFWLRKEAERENDRTRYDHRAPCHKFFKPDGNEGPGFLARLAGWKPNARVGTFRWLRERRQSRNRWADCDQPIACTLEVPADQLVNVSAYTPGDFRQFFADRRTRAQYLQWAPALIAAEEYHAGRLKPQEPGELPAQKSRRRRW